MVYYNESNYQENMIKKSFFVHVEPDKLTAYYASHITLM
jgi:hypothetical protein